MSDEIIHKDQAFEGLDTDDVRMQFKELCVSADASARAKQRNLAKLTATLAMTSTTVGTLAHASAQAPTSVSLGSTGSFTWLGIKGVALWLFGVSVGYVGHDMMGSQQALPLMHAKEESNMGEEKSYAEQIDVNAKSLAHKDNTSTHSPKDVDKSKLVHTSLSRQSIRPKSAVQSLGILKNKDNKPALDQLKEELKLLAGLDEFTPTQRAKDALDEHSRRFPEGQLKREREILRKKLIKNDNSNTKSDS